MLKTQRRFAWKKVEQKCASIYELKHVLRTAAIVAPTMHQTGAQQEFQSARWSCLEMGLHNEF